MRPFDRTRPATGRLMRKSSHLTRVMYPLIRAPWIKAVSAAAASWGYLSCGTTMRHACLVKGDILQSQSLRSDTRSAHQRSSSLVHLLSVSCISHGTQCASCPGPMQAAHLTARSIFYSQPHTAPLGRLESPQVITSVPSLVSKIALVREERDIRDGLLCCLYSSLFSPLTQPLNFPKHQHLHVSLTTHPATDTTGTPCLLHAPETITRFSTTPTPPVSSLATTSTAALVRARTQTRTSLRLFAATIRW